MSEIKLTSFNSDESKNFSVSDDAVLYIRRIAQKNSSESKPFFRIAVEGGGCSGFQYNYSFDSKNESDLSFYYNDVKIVISPESFEFIKGSMLDFYEDFGGSGLTVKNPNATGTCGCGVSFSV